MKVRKEGLFRYYAAAGLGDKPEVGDHSQNT
jgi:hypothetical protein